jgi:hypothetical protein
VTNDLSQKFLPEVGAVVGSFCLTGNFLDISMITYTPCRHPLVSMSVLLIQGSGIEISHSPGDGTGLVHMLKAAPSTLWVEDSAMLIGNPDCQAHIT